MRMARRHGGIRMALAALGALLAAGIIIASEESATEKALQKMLTFKDKGFVNVKGERRGFLAKGGVLKQRIKLFAQQEYLAVVAGDEEIKSLQLIVTDKKGEKVIMKSEAGGPVATLQFTPTEKEKYTFLIECPDTQGYYHFSLVTK